MKQRERPSLPLLGLERRRPANDSLPVHHFIKMKKERACRRREGEKKDATGRRPYLLLLA